MHNGRRSGVIDRLKLNRLVVVVFVVVVACSSILKAKTLIFNPPFCGK